MKKFWIVLAMVLFSASMSLGQGKAAEKEAIGFIQKLFSEMAAHNPSAIAAMFTKDSNLTALVTRKDGTKRVAVFTGEAFSKNFTEKKNEIFEHMYKPEAEVDGDLAVVYGRYVFFVDSKVSHCGLNSFNLVRIDGAWKIANATSSIDPGGCTEKEKKMKQPAK